MMLNLKERDRRYQLVRKGMAGQSLDAMLVICDAQIEKKGLLKYLTNYRNTLYNLVAIFPREGEPKMFVPSAVQKVWAERLSWISNVEEQKPSLGEALVRNIKKMGLEKARLGLASPKIMTAEVYNYLVTNLPKVTIVDATSVIEDLRKIKSPAEQELVKGTARMADLSFQVLAEVLKPGMTERELIAEVDRRLVCEGAQDIFHLICSKPGDLMPFVPTDRTIRFGDTVIFNTELSGPGGYWIQMVRTAFVGEPTGETEKMYDALLGIINQLPEKLVPGVKTCDIANWVITETSRSGYEVGVHFGHCLGLDVVENPRISTTDPELLQAGMVLTVHPQFVTADKKETVWYADSYLIKEDGPAEVLTTIDPEMLKLKF
jgi:Xaa-Pro aminopeptidase